MSKIVECDFYLDDYAPELARVQAEFLNRKYDENGAVRESWLAEHPDSREARALRGDYRHDSEL